MGTRELLASHTHWNVLKFFSVADIPSLVEKLVDTLPCGSVEAQLRARKIYSFRLILMKNTQALLVPIFSNDKEYEIPDCFKVALKKDSTINEWVFSVAHELGHTFAFNCDIDGSLERIWSRVKCYYCEEVFADEFARQWLRRGNNREELYHLLSVGLLHKK